MLRGNCCASTGDADTNGVEEADSQVGMVISGYLVEVQKVHAAEMAEWREKYSEVFSRDYNTASGLRFNAWVERCT